MQTQVDKIETLLPNYEIKWSIEFRVTIFRAWFFASLANKDLQSFGWFGVIELE